MPTLWLMTSRSVCDARQTSNDLFASAIKYPNIEVSITLPQESKLLTHTITLTNPNSNPNPSPKRGRTRREGKRRAQARPTTPSRLGCAG